jgi:hypothetical protein
MFHGSKGTLYVNRSFYRVIPERGSGLEPVEVKSSNNSSRAPPSACWPTWLCAASCAWTVQKEPRKFLTREYRKPWKLLV